MDGVDAGSGRRCRLSNFPGQGRIHGRQINMLFLSVVGKCIPILGGRQEVSQKTETHAQSCTSPSFPLDLGVIITHYKTHASTTQRLKHNRHGHGLAACARTCSVYIPWIHSIPYKHTHSHNSTLVYQGSRYIPLNTTSNANTGISGRSERGVL